VDLPKVSVRWSAPIPYKGADASPIPSRGGVYELLYEDVGGVERMFVGHTQDLRRAFVSHLAGSKGDEEVRRGMMNHTCYFRYWICDNLSRCLEVVSALADAHYYECGHEEVPPVACVHVFETE
jgi:hypothetical protein